MNVSTHWIGLEKFKGQTGIVGKMPPETIHIGNHELVKGDSVLFFGEPVYGDKYYWVRRSDIITAKEA